MHTGKRMRQIARILVVGLSLAAIATCQTPTTTPRPAGTGGPGGPGGFNKPMPADTPLGGGEYKALMEGVPGLPLHTIYRPADLKALNGQKLPVVLWGNGACSDVGSSFRTFLEEISSYGYFIVALGAVDKVPGPMQGPAPGTGSSAPRGLPPPATHTPQLIEALDWAVKENDRADSPFYHVLDTSKIAVMGQSCGGVQAIEASADPRISTSMIWNSGLFPAPTTMAGGKSLTKEFLKQLHAPIAYISGDAQDVAFPNANDDFVQIAHVPVFRAYERGVTHGAFYRDANGGEFSGVAIAWLNWQLKGDKKSSLMFVGQNCGLCVNPRWVVQKKKIE